MKNQMWLVWCISVLLTGCTFGFVPTGLESARPYLTFWDKPAMTIEDRRDDWVECGGSSDGSFSPYIGLLNKERRPEEKDRSAAHYRLDNELQRCMLNKGYRYTGKCYDNEISRTSPACAVMGK